MNDTQYFVARRRGEDAALLRASAAASRCEREVEAGRSIGLHLYTWAWAAWSARWDGGAMSPAAALALAKKECPRAFAVA